MHRNKRTGCKQNNLTKKVQLTLPSHLQTEEGPKHPSLSTLEQKTLNKTKERIRTLNQTKKSISLKSTNKTLHASFCGQSPKMNKLVQELRESKAFFELTSKSPKSYTSKVQRGKANRPLQSECCLRSGKKLGKLQITMQKLDLAILLADEPSEMALASTSSQSVRQGRTPLIEIQDDEINFHELRQFCQNSGMKVVQSKLSSHSLRREQKAACKIQRAWKRYRTRLIITRYAQIISSRSSSSRLSECEFFCPYQQELLLSSEDLYNRTSPLRHNCQISDLSGALGQPRRSQYEAEVERIRREHVGRWDDVIRIINSTDHADPLKMQELLSQILLKYQNTKKALLQSTEQLLNSNGRGSPQSIDQDEPKPIEVGQAALRVLEAEEPSPQSKSQNSIEMEGYNCNKYVRNFDCDFFLPQQRSQSTLNFLPRQDQFQKCKISKMKQEQLLRGLQSHKASQLGSDIICNSLASIHRRQVSESLQKLAFTRTSIRKVLSQKRISLFTDQTSEDQTMVAAQKDYQQSDFSEGIPGIQLTGIVREQKQSEQQSVFLERPSNSMQFYETAGGEPEPSFFKLNTIQQEEYGGEALLAANELRVKQIAVLVLNTLTLQALKDISRSELVTYQFKKYARFSRLRIRTGSSGGKKKGFPTDKKEIESFLESIVGYIETYEPAVFRNLQVATGPSALEMLRFMHEQQREESFSVCEDSQSEASIMVVPNRIFELFWQLKEKSIIVEVPEGFDRSNMALFKQNLDYLKSFNKIFYRSLFDTLNQCLDCHRNFGQRGRPFPWKNKPSFTHPLSQEQISKEVSQAKKHMIEVATTYCGLIIDKEEMEDLGGSEEYVAQLQEDRLSRMLASDLVECEHKWTFYDDEEAELLIELSSFAFGCLLLESISQIYVLGQV